MLSFEVVVMERSILCSPYQAFKDFIYTVPQAQVAISNIMTV